MLKSAWALGVGSLLTLWYAGRVVLLSFFGSRESLCRSCNSVDGVLHPFKKGPFVMAIEGGVPIVSVGLVGSRAIMPKGSFRIRPGTITVRVGEPISVEGMRHSDRDGLRDTVRDAVARLRGGEGRTSRLPGEPPLDDVPEPSSSNPS